jgi:hypothetical protein
MEKQNQREPEGAREKERRPYERPTVSWEEDFEPYVFSTCGKMPGGGLTCLASNKS